MKKWLARIIAIVAILTLSVCCLTACGGVQGTYEFKSYKIGDTTYTVNKTDEDGKEIKPESITLKKGGVLIYQTYTENTKTEAEGTWVLKEGTENVYILKAGTLNVEATIQDGTLTFTRSLIVVTRTYIFEK